MKKVLVVLMALVMCLGIVGLTACSIDTTAKDDVNLTYTAGYSAEVINAAPQAQPRFGAMALQSLLGTNNAISSSYPGVRYGRSLDSTTGAETMMGLKELASTVWLNPTHVIMEVPSEVCIENGVATQIKWTQVSVNWENGGSTWYRCLLIDLSVGGSFTFKDVNAVVQEDVPLYQAVFGYKAIFHCRTIDGSFNPPAPRNVWAIQN